MRIIGTVLEDKDREFVIILAGTSTNLWFGPHLLFGDLRQEGGALSFLLCHPCDT